MGHSNGTGLPQSGGLLVLRGPPPRKYLVQLLVVGLPVLVAGFALLLVVASWGGEGATVSDQISLGLFFSWPLFLIGLVWTGLPLIGIIRRPMIVVDRRRLTFRTSWLASKSISWDDIVRVTGMWIRGGEFKSGRPVMCLRLRLAPAQRLPDGWIALGRWDRKVLGSAMRGCPAPEPPQDVAVLLDMFRVPPAQVLKAVAARAPGGLELLDELSGTRPRPPDPGTGRPAPGPSIG